MLIIIISRSSLKLDHVGSKTRLLGHQATQVSDLGPLWPSCSYYASVETIVILATALDMFKIICIISGGHLEANETVSKFCCYNSIACIIFNHKITLHF